MRRYPHSFSKEYPEGGFQIDIDTIPLRVLFEENIDALVWARHIELLLKDENDKVILHPDMNEQEWRKVRDA